MLLKILIRILATAVTVLLIANFVPGIVIASFYTALVVAIVWGILSITIRPILTLLTLPINLLTFGLFSFILNALLFWLVAGLVPGFEVHGFVPALLGSAILSIVSWTLHRVW
jgi:putative membrane protein